MRLSVGGLHATNEHILSISCCADEIRNVTEIRLQVILRTRLVRMTNLKVLCTLYTIVFPSSPSFSKGCHVIITIHVKIARRGGEQRGIRMNGKRKSLSEM
jgi:hypothetical protein